MSKTKALLLTIAMLVAFIVLGALTGRLVEWAAQSSAIYWLFGAAMLFLGFIAYRDLRKG